MTARLILAAVLALFAFAPMAFADSPQHMTWNVGGETREALVFAPTTALATTTKPRMPLVLVFHGHGGNMNAAADHMALQNDWPEAVVVYLQGLPSPGVKTNRGEAPGWQFEAGQAGDRDLKFVDAVLATMKQTYPIDDNRVYASGFSQGAFFTLLLWSKRAQDFAAFAACAVSLIPPLQLTQPRAYLQISGEDDQLIPMAAQMRAIDAAKQVDGAIGPGQPCGMGCTSYASPGGTPVVTLIHLGGHIYPPGLSTRIVDFFKHQTRH